MIDLLLLAVGVIGGGAIGFGIGQSVESKRSAMWERIAAQFSVKASFAERQCEALLERALSAEMRLDVANERVASNEKTQIFATPLPSTDLEFDEEEPAMVDPAA